MLNFSEILKIVSSIQQINIQTMIVKHKFELYKLLVTKFSSYQAVGYQVVGYQIVNYQNLCNQIIS